MKLKKLSKTAMALALACAMAFNASTAFATEITGSATASGYQINGRLRLTTTSATAITFTPTAANYAYLEVDLKVTKQIASTTSVTNTYNKYNLNNWNVEETQTTSSATPFVEAVSYHYGRGTSNSSTASFTLGSIKP